MDATLTHLSFIEPQIPARAEPPFYSEMGQRNAESAPSNSIRGFSPWRPLELPARGRSIELQLVLPRTRR